MSSDDDQAHFAREYRHFILDPVRGLKPPRKKPTRPPDDNSDDKRFHKFMERSKTRFGELKNAANEIFEKSAKRGEVYPDDRVYFKVIFSDELSWPGINQAYNDLKGETVRITDDKTVKLAIRKSKYPAFVLSLYHNRKLIKAVTETTLPEKADEMLAKILTSEPSADVDVTIQVFDASGLRDAEQIESSVRRYLESRQAGSIAPIYLAETWGVFEIRGKAGAVNEIQDALGTSQRIELVPEISLVPSNRPSYDEEVELSSIIKLEEPRAPVGILPIVCAIDSGINKDHQFLNPYLAETYDYSTDSTDPCSDGDNHGSMVAGLAVYGGNLDAHHQPVARVIMAKGFERRSPIPNKRIINMIADSVDRFGSKTRTFNLSFAAHGPNLEFSEILNDIIYRKEVVVAAASGNIPKDTIMAHLNGSPAYPDYLRQHLIYFPGDCDNALTVGSFAPNPSNAFRGSSPSPFTTSGHDRKKVKPDLLAEGGNMDTIRSGGVVSDLDTSSVGVKSTSALANGFGMSAGSSLSCPMMASLASRILERYPRVSPFTVKALILSTCKSLASNGTRFDDLVQGYGIPDDYQALNSSDWRATYLFGGGFTGQNPLEYDEYEFYVPDNTDRFTVTFTTGKPAWSKGWFTFRLIKPGVKYAQIPVPIPGELIGDKETGKHITTTYREVHAPRRGGKGDWRIRILPHFDGEPGVDRSLKYGCAVTVESLSNKSVYRQIQGRYARPRPVAKLTVEEKAAAQTS